MTERDMLLCLRFADRVQTYDVYSYGFRDDGLAVHVADEVEYIDKRTLIAYQYHGGDLLNVLFEAEEAAFDRHFDKNLVALSEPLC